MRPNGRCAVLLAAMRNSDLVLHWRSDDKADKTEDWRCQVRGDEAALFASVYGWLTEGFDRLDLKEAKTLLDQRHARQPIRERPLS